MSGSTPQGRGAPAGGGGQVEKKRLCVAVDGPAGAGKGSVCRGAAEALGLAYLDTGTIYRAMGLIALRRELTDAEALAAAARAMDFQFSNTAPGQYGAFLDGEEVTARLRDEEVGLAASQVSALPPVRAALLDFQRGYGDGGDVILDGRDVGTVVLPDAPLKIFLTASLEARAKRRALELQEAGKAVSFQQIHARISERDARDRERSHAPMVPAVDAILIDTTELTLAQSVDRVTQLVARARDELAGHSLNP